MVSKKFGEVKGPLIMWVVFTLYFVTLVVFGSPSGGTIPQDFTMVLVLPLLFSMMMSGGVLLIFIIVFLVFWEKQRSMKDIFSSVGLKRDGFVRSVLWGVALFPSTIAVGLVLMMLSYFLGPVPFLSASVSSTGQFPVWYLYYMIVSSFFPTAVVEEVFGRGYMLDRLMPQHPSSLAKALPAIFLSSLLFTLWHLPSYLRVYSFSLPWTIALLAGDIFPLSVVLGIAYVRARARNVAGPILIHFLLDSMTMILRLIGAR